MATERGYRCIVKFEHESGKVSASRRAVSVSNWEHELSRYFRSTLGRHLLMAMRLGGQN
jgi:hypothetical protein